MFVVMCSGAAMAAITALHIHTSTHGVVTVLLDDEPVLEFNDDRTVTASTPSKPDSEPLTLDFDDIDKCEYGEPDDYTSSLIETTKSAITVRLDADGVTFGNLPDGAEIEVYAIDGTVVLRTNPGLDAFRLDRQMLGHGVRIVRIGQFTTKLTL